MKSRRPSPTKTELLQLQKLYKTDEKIGERLGGVPAYLVAYWRRKKNIPKHSLPKFSETEVRTLWERYGDDEKAGLELGLSKAAFYNWRRRYGIKEKPQFLKLEQLEFNFPGAKLSPHAANLYGEQTVAQKILARAAGKEKVEVGETVMIEPDLISSGASTLEAIRKFRESHADFVWNNSRIAAVTDMFESETLSDQEPRLIREFVKRQRLKQIYDMREGLTEQVIIERGHVLPGQIISADHSLHTAFGALSALSLAVNTEQVVSGWAKGKLTFKVPGTVRLSFSGRRSRAVSARDLHLAALKQLGEHFASGLSIEFGGSLLSSMSMSERITLSSLAGEFGAVATICPYDAATRRFVTSHGTANYKPTIPDKNAEYLEMYQVVVDHLGAQVSQAGTQQTIRPAAELDGTPISVVLIGSMVSGRFEDLRIAADLLRSKQVNGDCLLLILPASRSVYLEALKKGLIRLFSESGAVLLSSQVQAESMIHKALNAGERCLTTMSLRNFSRPIMPEAPLYFCSPATAAVSALHGTISDPAPYLR